MTIIPGLIMASGVVLIFIAVLARQGATAKSVAMYSGVAVHNSNNVLRIVGQFIEQMLSTHRFAPWGTFHAVQQQLTHAGSSHSVSYFRRQQLLAFVASEFVFTVWLMLRATASSLPSTSFILVFYVVLCPLSGAVSFELLKNKAKARANRIDLELPTTLDLLAFSLVAGEPIVLALQRVARTCSGELALLIRQSSEQLDAGETLLVTLRTLRTNTASTNLFRAVHGIEIAIDRGTPLADVLRAQAEESRSQYRAQLLRLAGKKETFMMLPVVFMILPMIVLVALFPGLEALQLR